MAVGVRTEDLHKVYSSAPPPAAGAGFISRPAGNPSSPKRRSKPWNGLFLEVNPGEIFGLFRSQRRRKVHDSRSPHHASPRQAAKHL